MKRILSVIGILLLAGLAYVHWILPGKIESSINAVISHEPLVAASDAERLHESLFVADLHADSLLWKRDLRQESRIGHVDVPRLKAGNVALQVFSATTKSPDSQNYSSNTGDSDRITLLAIAQLWPPRTWFSLYERAVYQLDKLHALAADSDVAVIESAQDLEDVIRRRSAGETIIGAVYLIEGAHPLQGDLENLDRLFDRGLRIVGLTHFFDNALGGSLHGVSGDGLTGFGRAVVRRASALNLIIDIAHASPAMVEDVLEMSTAPVILSHGGLKGACDTDRNLPDDLMIRFAEAGGLIGIGYWDGAVCDSRPEGIVKSLRYAIDLLGVDHVALGSDYDGAVRVHFDTSRLPLLTGAMLAAGFTEEEIRRVSGENVKRFLLQNLPDR